MTRQVYLENWQEQLEATVEDVLHRASAYGLESVERLALLGDLQGLREMARQVQLVPPLDRDTIKSTLLPLHVREPLQVPEDLVNRIGELFEIYRRFRKKLTWLPV
jgi:hypothetical protein